MTSPRSDDYVLILIRTPLNFFIYVLIVRLAAVCICTSKGVGVVASCRAQLVVGLDPILC